VEISVGDFKKKRIKTNRRKKTKKPSRTLKIRRRVKP
jgi:hypothetical protein